MHTKLSDPLGQTEFSAKMEIGLSHISIHNNADVAKKLNQTKHNKWHISTGSYYYFYLIICAGYFVSPELKIYLILALPISFVKKSRIVVALHINVDICVSVFTKKYLILCTIIRNFSNNFPITKLLIKCI